MATLGSTARAKLPNTAFAYIDSTGRRRLPINDEAHVRNALARFSRVAFEDEAARETARQTPAQGGQAVRHRPGRLHHRPAPIGAELARREAGGKAQVNLPSGFVTMLMTDVEGSTALVHRLGDRYRELLNELRSFLTEAIVARDGLVVETRADELFAVFEAAAQALDVAVIIQRHLRSRTWDDGVEVRVRAGLHSGYPTQTDANYIGLPVHAAARISAAAHGGQILTSGDTRAAVRGSRPAGSAFPNPRIVPPSWPARRQYPSTRSRRPGWPASFPRSGGEAVAAGSGWRPAPPPGRGSLRNHPLRHRSYGWTAARSRRLCAWRAASSNAAHAAPGRPWWRRRWRRVAGRAAGILTLCSSGLAWQTGLSPGSGP